MQPEQWPILLGYVGNRSDNLFGIKGVGHTGILKYLNGVDVSPKLKNLVEASWADAQVQIKVNTLPIAEFELESPPMNHYDSREAIQVLKEHKLDFDTTNKFWSNIGRACIMKLVLDVEIPGTQWRFNRSSRFGRKVHTSLSACKVTNWKGYIRALLPASCGKLDS